MSDEQHEDPVAFASTRLTTWVSMATAAEATTQVAAARAPERAERAGC